MSWCVLTLHKHVGSPICWLTPLPYDVVQTEIEFVERQVLGLAESPCVLPFESSRKPPRLDLDLTRGSRPREPRTWGCRSPEISQVGISAYLINGNDMRDKRIVLMCFQR